MPDVIVTLGQSTMANSVPLAIASDQSAVPVSSGNTTRQYADSTSLLTANATFSGTGRDTGNTSSAPGAGYSRFRAFAHASLATASGTLNIQQSRDDSTWFVTFSQPVVGGTAAVIESLVTLRYVRVQYINGTTAQTGSFELDSALVSI